jgi:hypothetical protein
MPYFSYIYDTKPVSPIGPNGPHFFLASAQTDVDARAEVQRIYGYTASELANVQLFRSDRFVISPSSPYLEMIAMPAPLPGPPMSDPAPDFVVAGYARVDFDPVTDVTGGGTTRAIGFQLRNQIGGLLLAPTLLELAVFDDAAFTVPSTRATLRTATEGTILVGENTPALKIQTDAQGRFGCTLTNTLDSRVYFCAAPSYGSPFLDCRDTKAVTFSA